MKQDFSARPMSSVSTMSTAPMADPRKPGEFTSIGHKQQPVEEPEAGWKKFVQAVWGVKYRKRETSDSKERYIKTNLRNLVLYLIFLAILCIIVYGMVGLINYYFTSGMLSLFIDQPLNPTAATPVTFRTGFTTHEQVWQFLQGPLLQGLYWETWYDGSNTTANNLGYILYQNKLLGLPRLLQLRVADNTCTIPSSMANIVTDCAAPYSTWTASQAPFGKNANGSLPSGDFTYTAWNYAPQSSVTFYNGLVGIYSDSGYAITLGTTQAQTAAILADLYNNLWIDQYTRAIIIDFTVYNGNVNLFNQMRLVVEFPASGGMFTSWVDRTAKLLRYVSAFDYFIAACEALFVLFIVYYTIEEVLDICLNKKKYFVDAYNVMDLFILGLSYTTIIFNIYRTITVSNLLDSLLQNSNQYENFDTLTYCQELFDQASAVVIFFAWIKIFKYISLNRTLDQLNATLQNAAKDIFYFCVIFFIVFFSYGALGYLLFGQTLPDYQNFFKTLFTLFRIILGDFDFVSLRANFPVLGPIYFMTFVFIGFFILLNMFMAIINQSYNKVKKQMAESQPEFMLSDYLKMNYARACDKLTLRRNRILDIEEILKSDDIAAKDTLDFNTWRNELRKRGYADMEIESIFSKYDQDGDRKLNEIEKFKLCKDVAKARSHLSEEYRNFKDKRITTTKKDGFEVGDELDEQEIDDNGEPKKMTRDDFEYVLGRIDRMELSVASIINKIDKLFGHLESMELDKMKKRQEIAKLLNEQNNPDMERNLNSILGKEQD